MMNCLPQQKVKGAGKRFGICWPRKRLFFSPSDSSVLTVCPLPHDYRLTLPSWLISRVEKCQSDSKINLSIEKCRHSSLPACECQLFVWEQSLEKPLLKEKGKGRYRGQFKQTNKQKTLKKKNRKGGEGNLTKTAKRGKKPPTKTQPLPIRSSQQPSLSAVHCQSISRGSGGL